MVIKFTREQFYKAFDMAMKEQNKTLEKARQIEKEEEK